MSRTLASTPTITDSKTLYIRSNAESFEFRDVGIRSFDGEITFLRSITVPARGVFEAMKAFNHQRPDKVNWRSGGTSWVSPRGGLNGESLYLIDSSENVVASRRDEHRRLPALHYTGEMETWHPDYVARVDSRT